MDICSLSGEESDDSDMEEISVHFALTPDQMQNKVVTTNRDSSGGKRVSSSKRLAPCATTVSTALDARLENGVESTTEIRLRMMAVVDSEVLSQSLKSSIEVRIKNQSV